MNPCGSGSGLLCSSVARARRAVFGTVLVLGALFTSACATTQGAAASPEPSRIHAADPWERWNRQVFPNRISREGWARISTPLESSVLHFVGSTKPWDSWCDPVIAEFWWSFARKLGLADLAPTPKTRVAHYLELAKALDAKRDFEAASRIKGELIERLRKKVARKSS